MDYYRLLVHKGYYDILFVLLHSTKKACTVKNNLYTGNCFKDLNIFKWCVYFARAKCSLDFNTNKNVCIKGIFHSRQINPSFQRIEQKGMTFDRDFCKILILFIFPLFLEGKRKGENNNQSCCQKSCLSARSVQSVQMFQTNSCIFLTMIVCILYNILKYTEEGIISVFL